MGGSGIGLEGGQGEGKERKGEGGGGGFRGLLVSGGVYLVVCMVFCGVFCFGLNFVFWFCFG